MAICPTSAAPDEITLGVTVSGSNPGTGSANSCYYKVTLSGVGTDKQLRVNITTQADHDPFLKFGSPSVASPYDCSSSATPATFDQCIYSPAIDGDWYVRIQSFHSTLTGFNLTVFLEPAPAAAGCSLGSGITPLSSGVAQSGTLTGTDGNGACLFSFAATAASANMVSAALSGLSSNADIYLRRGGLPTNTTFDCAPKTSGTTAETCTSDLITDGSFYAMVRRGASSTGSIAFSVTATSAASCSLGNGVIPLTPGTGTTGTLTTDFEARCYFSWSPDAVNADIGRTVLNLSTQNYDLLVKRGSVPGNVSGSFDCGPKSTGTTNETCDLDITGNGATIFAQVRRAAGSTGGAAFTITPTNLMSCSLGLGVTPLTDGVPVSGVIQPILNGKCYFSMGVNPSTTDLAHVVLNLTNTDFDLYVRRDALPTLSAYDCRPFTSGVVNETCDVDLFAGNATVYSMVNRFSASGSAASFSITETNVASCSTGTGTTALTDGVVSPPASLASIAGSKCLFSFTPSAGFDLARFVMTPPGSANLDLYVKKGAAPTTTAFDCKPALGTGLAETCSLASDGVTPFFAMVRTVTSGGAFSVLATNANTCSLGQGITDLAENTAAAGSLTTDTGARCLFSFVPAANTDVVNVTMTPPGGSDFDLYLRKGALPTAAVYDCRPFSGTSVTEFCELDSDNSTWFANVSRFSGSGSFNITARSFAKCSLGTGVTSLDDGVAQAASLLNKAGGKCVFAFTPAPGADKLAIALSPTAGANFDLYLRKGAAPTNSTFDCSSTLGTGSADSCEVASDGSTWYATVSRVTGSGAFSITATSITTCSLGTGVSALDDGVTVLASLSNNAGAACRFSFDPAPGADLARVVLVSPAGANFDLYVKKGAMPTTGDNDCASATAGDELCELPSDGTTLYALVQRSSGSGEFSITPTSAATCSIGFNVNELAEDVVQTASLSGDAGAKCYYSFNPLASQADLGRFTLTPPAGADFDLYVKKGSLPTISSYDCLSANSGDAAETCDVDVVDATPFYAMVRRTSGSGEFEVRGASTSTCSLGTGLHALENGASVAASLLDSVGAKCYFEVTPPAGMDALALNVAVPAGADYDLYVKKGALPTVASNDCASARAGEAAEDCVLQVSDGTPFQLMVRRASGDGEFTVSATPFSTCSLGTGVTVLASGVAPAATLADLAWAQCSFRFVPDPAVADTASFALDPPAYWDADLYVKKGAPPTTSVYDCRPHLAASAQERCDLQVSDATPWYLLVRRVAGGGDFNVVAADVSSCSLGIGIHDLAGGAATAATLTAQSWAACRFGFVPNPAVSDGARFAMTPPAGSDFDLYARKGALPTTSVYDCRPFLGTGAAEQCELQVSDASPWYVLVRRATGSGEFLAQADGFSTCGLGPLAAALADGEPATTSLTTNAWAQCAFSFVAPANADSVRVAMAPPTGANYDLYVKKGAPPTTSSFDCRPALGTGAAETCVLQSAPGEVVYSLVKRVTGSGALQITATSANTCSLGPLASYVANATIAAGLSGDAWAQCVVKLTPAPGTDLVRGILLPPEGANFDLYVKKGAVPTTTSYDCAATQAADAQDQCDLLSDGLGDYYALVQRVSGSGTFSLQMRSQFLQELQLGVPRVGGVNEGGVQLFKVLVPADGHHVTVAIGGSPAALACAKAAVVQGCTPVNAAVSTVCAQGADGCSAAAGAAGTLCLQAAAACAPVDGPSAALYVVRASAAVAPGPAVNDCASTAPGLVQSCTLNTALHGAVGDVGAPVELKDLVVGGKYFVAVRGTHGTAQYAAVAVYA